MLGSIFNVFTAGIWRPIYGNVPNAQVLPRGSGSQWVRSLSSFEAMCPASSVLVLLNSLVVFPAARFVSAPVRITGWYGGRYDTSQGWALTCLHGSLECQDICCDSEKSRCTDFGSHFKDAEYAATSEGGGCGVKDDVTRRRECCECVSSDPPPPPPVMPNSSACSSECDPFVVGNLNCPAGYELSAPLLLCYGCNEAEGYALRVEHHVTSGWEHDCPQDEMGLWSPSYKLGSAFLKMRGSQVVGP